MNKKKNDPITIEQFKAIGVGSKVFCPRSEKMVAVEEKIDPELLVLETGYVLSREDLTVSEVEELEVPAKKPAAPINPKAKPKPKQDPRRAAAMELVREYPERASEINRMLGRGLSVESIRSRIAGDIMAKAGKRVRGE